MGIGSEGLAKGIHEFGDSNPFYQDQSTELIQYQYEINKKDDVNEYVSFYPAEEPEIFVNQKKNGANSCNAEFRYQRKG